MAPELSSRDKSVTSVCSFRRDPCSVSVARLTPLAAVDSWHPVAESDRLCYEYYEYLIYLHNFCEGSDRALMCGSRRQTWCGGADDFHNKQTNNADGCTTRCPLCPRDVHDGQASLTAATVRARNMVSHMSHIDTRKARHSNYTCSALAKIK